MNHGTPIGVFLRVHRRDEGFTLIELMIVVMIIAVLLMIGIPSFLGFRAKSQDRAAQASLITAEKVTYFVILEEGSVPGRAELLAMLPGIESSIDWIDHFDSSTRPNQVSLDETAAHQELALAAYSHSGSCFYLRVINGSPPAKKVVTNAATCQAHDYQIGADTGW
jgi:prepilin-type N-terminal cleavage/methylation domain-containing protein